MPSELLVVIPAPLHASGLPRAALRSLAGRSLILRALDTAAGSVASRDQIAVLVDDDEVALVAERQGCRVYPLPHATLEPDAALAACVYGVTRREEENRPAPFAAVAVLHPSAPLVRSGDLTRAVDRLSDNGVSSVMSEPLVGDAGWPTLGFVVSRRDSVTPEQFVARDVVLADLPAERALRIQSANDWWVCERLLRRKRVAIVVIGYPAVGLGHVSRSSIIAHELMHHDVCFVCPDGSDLAAAQLAPHTLPIHRQAGRNLAEAVLAFEPDLVINDILNTDRDYVEQLMAGGAAVVNFEDLGSGAHVADLVINAIFMETDVPENHLNGPAYFCIRDEFLQAPQRQRGDQVREVLVTFGGTDAVDSTARLARLLLPITRPRGIHVSLVTGPGYSHLERLTELLHGVPAADVTLAHNTKRISEYMARADLAFSSAGRTVFELAAMGVPAVILAANEREETHTFASAENGFLHLGRNDQTSDAAIVSALERLLESAELRRTLSERMCKWDFHRGRERVMAALDPLLARERKVLSV
jgi:spore coat polysaccharide biosynthesis predicted glycosyltransferase SpsG